MWVENIKILLIKKILLFNNFDILIIFYKLFEVKD